MFNRDPHRDTEDFFLAAFNWMLICGFSLWVIWLLIKAPFYLFKLFVDWVTGA